jgi:hypothetical protein
MMTLLLTMNAQQLQKWSIIRLQGRSRYIVKRVLLWGGLFSVGEVLLEYLFRFYFSPSMVDYLSRLFFSKAHSLRDPELQMQKFILSSLEGIGMCLLLAAFIAFTIWTVKEREFATAQRSQPV